MYTIVLLFLLIWGKNVSSSVTLDWCIQSFIGLFTFTAYVVFKLLDNDVSSYLFKTINFPNFDKSKTTSSLLYIYYLYSIISICNLIYSKVLQ